MVKRIFRAGCFLVIITLLFYSCKTKNNNPVIKFSADSTSVIISNISKTDLSRLKNDPSLLSDSAGLISAIVLPDDTAQNQNEQLCPGHYRLMGDSILFTPDLPFIKNTRYLIESFIGVNHADVNKLLQGSIGTQLTPQKQVLKR